MLKVKQVTILLLFMIALHAELLFKVTHVKDGAFLELPKTDKPIGKPVGEDSFFVTPISLTVGDGVGGCKFSSSFISRYLTRGATIRILEKRRTDQQNQNANLDLEAFTELQKKSISADIKDYTELLDQIFHGVEPTITTEDEKKVMQSRYLYASTTFVSASIHYSEEQKAYFLHMIQKGDSLAVVFRKMVSNVDSQTGQIRYHYLPVFMTNAQQAAGFNAPDQFEQYDPQYKDSKDDVLYFKLQEHDLVLLASDGVYDNVPISWLTYALNLYIQANTNPQMFNLPTLDVLDTAFDNFCELLEQRNEEIEQFIARKSEDRQRNLQDPDYKEKSRDSLSHTIILPKKYESREAHTKVFVRHANNSVQRLPISAVNRVSLDPQNDKQPIFNPNGFGYTRNAGLAPVQLANIVTGQRKSVSPIGVLYGQKMKINQPLVHHAEQQVNRLGFVRPPQKLPPGINPLNNIDTNKLRTIVDNTNQQNEGVRLASPANMQFFDQKKQANNNEQIKMPQNPRDIQGVSNALQQGQDYNENAVEIGFRSRNEYNSEVFHKRMIPFDQKLDRASVGVVNPTPEGSAIEGTYPKHTIGSINRVTGEIKRLLEPVSAEQKKEFEIEHMTPFEAPTESKINRNGVLSKDNWFYRKMPNIEATRKTNHSSRSANEDVHQVQNMSNIVPEYNSENAPKANKKNLRSGSTNSENSGIFPLGTNGKISLSKFSNMMKSRALDKEQASINIVNFNKKQMQIPSDFLKNVQNKGQTPTNQVIKFFTEKSYPENRDKNERILVGKMDVVEDRNLRSKIELASKAFSQRSFFKVDVVNLISEPADTFTEELIHKDVAQAIRQDFAFTEGQINAFVNNFKAAEFSHAIASMTKRITERTSYYPSPFYIQAKVMLPPSKKIPPVGKQDDITVAAGLVVDSNFSSDDMSQFIQSLEEEEIEFEVDALDAVENFKWWMLTMFYEAQKRKQITPLPIINI